MFMRVEWGQFLEGFSNVHQNHPLFPVYPPEGASQRTAMRKNHIWMSGWPFPDLDRLREQLEFVPSSHTHTREC